MPRTRTGCPADVVRLFFLFLGVVGQPVWTDGTLALSDVFVSATPSPTSSPTPTKRPITSFFASTNLSSFFVELGPAEFGQLAQSPRKYVAGRVTVDGQVFEHVGVRLKGTGTFEPISRNPNLTLKFNWQIPTQELGGVTKLFLNNSQQDPTFFCELAASGAFADAGLAVPRITHARLRLNGRDLGPRVAAEAVNKRLLKRHFGSSRGNLYEGAFQDVRGRMEQDNGEAEDRSDLRRLVAATAQADPDLRRKALGEVLDINQFLTFLAIEMIIANWDGYALHQNNYRVYHNPQSDRMVFIPHGMDNAFFESGLSLMPPRKSLLAAALLSTPEEREQFRQRLASLLPVVLDPGRIHARLSCAVAKVSQGASPAEAKAFERRARLLEMHVEERVRHLEAELAGQHPQSPSFDEQGIARVEGWLAKPDWNESEVQRLVVGGTDCLSITSENNYCFGSWRLPVWLPVGQYRVEGLVRTSGVRGLASRTGSGAGVRVLGTMRGGGVQGSSDWTPVQHQFVVTEDCEWVELIAELRAFRGSTLFDPKDFRLVRLRP